MYEIWSLVTLLTILTGVAVSQDVKGVVYVPGVLGVGKTVNAYSSYYDRIHDRDLPLIAKAGFNTVITVDLGLTDDSHSRFFKKCADEGLDVIASFGLQKYNLDIIDIKSVNNSRRGIVSDFKAFLNIHSGLPGIVGWTIGHVDDTLMLPEDPVIRPGGPFVSDLAGLFGDMIAETASHDGTTYLFAWSHTFNTEQDWMFDAFNNVSFNRWILNAAGAPSQSRIFNNYDSNSKDFLMQFNQDAWDRIKATEDQAFQKDSIARILSDASRANNNAYKGFIITEWTDTLWRGSPHDVGCDINPPPVGRHCGNCSSETSKPYLHSDCGFADPSDTDITVAGAKFNSVQWFGLGAPFDVFGTHCIRFRNATGVVNNGDGKKVLELGHACVFAYTVFGEMQFAGFFIITSAIILAVAVLSFLTKESIQTCFRSSDKEQLKKVLIADASGDSDLKQAVAIRARTYKVIHEEYEDEFFVRCFSVPSIMDHIRQQQSSVDSMIAHQRNFPSVRDDWQAYDIALKIVFNRMLEGFFVWLVQMNPLQLAGKKDTEIYHRYKNKILNMETFKGVNKLTTMYGLVVLFRVIGSLGEHIIHCPERLAQIFFQIIKNVEVRNGKPLFIIDLNYLHKGMDDVMYDQLNFDDINDHARDIQNLGDDEYRRPMKKSWHESKGVTVLLDTIRNYLAFFMFKAWTFGVCVFLASVIYSDTFDVDQGKIFRVFCEVEVVFFSAIEISLTIYYYYQHREISGRQYFYAVFAICSTVLVFASQQLLQKDHKELALIVLLIYAGARFFSFIYWVLGADDWKRVDFPGRIGPRRSLAENRVGQAFFWILGLVMTMAFETLAIAPIGAHFSVKHMCFNTDIRSFSTYAHVNVACVSGVVLAYCLLGLTVFVDTYMVFNILVSVFGYFVRNGRMVRTMFTKENFNSHAMHLSKTLRKELFRLPGQGERVWEALVYDLRTRHQISHEAHQTLRDGLKKDLNFCEMLEEPRDRLAFFLRTTSVLAKANAQNQKLQSICTEWVPKVSQILTSFQEDIYKSFDFLCSQNGPCTNLDHFIKRHRYEWQFLEDSLSQTYPEVRDQLYMGTGTDLRTLFLNINREDISSKEGASVPEWHDTVNFHVKDWCAMRSQTVARTIRGAVSYHRAIDQLFDLGNDDHEHYLKIPESYISARKLQREYKPPAERKSFQLLAPDEPSLNGSPPPKKGRKWRPPFLKHDPRDDSPILTEPLLEGQDEKELRLPQPSRKGTHGYRLDSVGESPRGNHKGANDPQNYDSEHSYQPLNPYVELIWAHQLYGSPNPRDKKWRERRLDTDILLERFRDYPISIIYYWMRPKDENDVGDMGAYAEVIRYWRKNYPLSPIPEYACVVKKWVWEDATRQRGRLRVVRCMPLRYPPRLGTKDKTQGKSANQMNAVRLVTGHVIQVMDANMDSYIGEGFKVPFVTSLFNNLTPNEKPTQDTSAFKKCIVCQRELGERQTTRLNCGHEFHTQCMDEILRNYQDCPNCLHLRKFSDTQSVSPVGSSGGGGGNAGMIGSASAASLLGLDSSSDGGVDRDSSEKVVRLSDARYRVIGFREYIYTTVTGAIGKQMANQEYSWSSIFQRVLTNPLNVRMHYGHPDYFDSFWVISRGMLSKGSANINLSEDVFAGYTIFGRQERNLHVDILEWQKGREETFLSSSGFLAKISAGSVGVLRSRDLMHVHRKLQFLMQISSFYGGLSFFLGQLAIDWTIFLYVASYTLLGLAGIDVGELGTIEIGLVWIVSFAFSTALPLFAELALERGMINAIKRSIINFVPSGLFYLFQNKTVAMSVQTGIMTGKASYINTGRPTGDQHYSTVDAYLIYAYSHYNPAIRIIIMYYVYAYLSLKGAATVPFAMLMLTSIMWIVPPIIFSPQASYTIREDTKKAVKFIIGTGAKQASLFGYWRQFHRELIDRTFVTRLFSLICQAGVFVLLMMASFSIAVDFAVLLAVTTMIHVPLTLLVLVFLNEDWTISKIVRGIWTLYPFVALIAQMVRSPTLWFAPDKVLGIAIFLLACDTVDQAVMLFCSVIVRMIYRKATPPVYDPQQIQKPKIDYSRETKGQEILHKISDVIWMLSLDFHVQTFCAVFVLTAQGLIACVMRILQPLIDSFHNINGYNMNAHKYWVKRVDKSS